MPAMRRLNHRPRIPPALRRVVLAVVLFLVFEYLVLPQVAGVRKALSLVTRVSPRLLVAGIVAEFAAFLAYAKLTQAVLPRGRGRRPGLFTLLRIQFSTLAVSHLVPGGAAASSGLGFRLLAQAGVSGPDAGFALGAQSLGSAVVLNVLLWLGLVISIPLRGFNPLYATAGIVGAVLIGAFGLVVVLLTRGEERAAQAVCRVASHVPVLDGDSVNRLVHALADRLRALASNRPVLLAAVGWAAANWLLDAASLWIFIAAFGFRVGVDGLIVAYGLANVLAAIPITPSGMGVVEAVLTPTLVGFGAPRGIAILGVISYRLFNFWLPIPLGGLTYLSLTVDRQRPAGRGTRELRELAEGAVKEGEALRRWAGRHGVRLGETPEPRPTPAGGSGDQMS